MTVPRRILTGVLAAAAASALMAAPAGASPLDPSGVLRIVRHPSAQLSTSQSGNWFGYNQGALALGGKLFNSISADWTVPAVTQHTSGQAESSATWIGIGGGCLDAGCALADVTLVQTGTEQDVDSSGHSTYSAWWELVPTPAVTISNLHLAPGDRIHASVSESPAGSDMWTITLKDLSKNETFSTAVPYTSTHSTAEWIEETPLTIGSNQTGQAALPRLTATVFQNAAVNGAPAQLAAGQQLQLVDSSGRVIGTPSAPAARATAFADCAWSTRCTFLAPSSSTAPKRGATGHHGSRHAKPRHRRRRHRRAG